METKDRTMLTESFATLPHYREYVMVSTIITAKLLDLLHIIGYSERYDTRLKRMADDLYQETLAYKKSVVMAAAANSQFSTSALLYASTTYDKYDKTLISASIEKKIEFWNQMMDKAIKLQQRMPPNCILFTPFSHPIGKEDLIELTNEQIVEELLDYADEIDAWLDLYFTDEYDDFSDDGKFVETVRIIEGLKFIADKIDYSNNGRQHN